MKKVSKAMFIITHKNIENKIALKDFYYLGVGKNKNNAEFSDSSQENISEKNPNYCELTGLFWIWKNTNHDEVGLCHYRRFFSKIVNNNYEVMNIDELSSLLNKSDIVVAKKINVYMDYFTFYEKCLRNNALRRCCEMLISKYPEYEESIKTLLKKKENYCFNMFYCKKDLIDEYCEWLFDILFDFEKRVDMSGWNVQQQRVYGFIAEFLLNVWIEKNGLKVKEVDVAQSENFPVSLEADAEKLVVNPTLFKKMLYKFLPVIWPFLSKRIVRESIKDV